MRRMDAVASWSGVLRFCLWSLPVAAAGIAALVGYSIYSYSSPPSVQLAGTLAKSSLEVDGLVRTYRTYLPSGLAEAAPLVVVMHGSGENGARIRTETGYGFDRAADRHGFAVVYPDAYGVGDWETCSIVGRATTKERAVDDVRFLTRLVDRLARDIAVDPKRVFAAGSSRGGSMAIRLALEAPSRFRAVAAVSANVPTAENFGCKPAGRSTSIMIMNGTKDPLVPFDGGNVSLFGLFYKNGKVRSSRESAQYFADLNHIDAAPQTTQTEVADGVGVEQVLWRDDRELEVELVAIHGGGHGMPQPYRRRPWLLSALLLGPSPREPNGPEMIWSFFDRLNTRGLSPPLR